MDDPLIVGLRFGLYATLLPLFGIPLFALTAPGNLMSRRLLRAIASTAILLSALALVASVAAMADTSLVEVDPALVRTVIAETAMGWAWIARLAAQVAIVVLAKRLSTATLAGLASVALASLAWTGHGAAGEGSVGWVQLAADIVHLLAAGAWIGALVVLLTLLWQPVPDRQAQAVLASFSQIGTITVALILATGLLNSAILIGWRNIGGSMMTPYGQLLAFKLILFLGMLVLAALNRFRLTPALSADPSRRALRLSLAFETGMAVVILALVAWLGTLAPPDLE